MTLTDEGGKRAESLNKLSRRVLGHDDDDDGGRRTLGMSIAKDSWARRTA
jgi:hypothetical protein